LRGEPKLPVEILARATRSGKEYAWPVEYIPRVIEAARQADLLNVGGQLQFILPDATCELYWLDIDTFKLVPETLPWSERVERTAVEAAIAFNKLRTERDFVSEGRKEFADHLTKFEKAGGDLSEVMRFVWYVEAQPTS
jgi:hypothetical protein